MDQDTEASVGTGSKTKQKRGDGFERMLGGIPSAKQIHPLLQKAKRYQEKNEDRKGMRLI